MRRGAKAAESQSCFLVSKRRKQKRGVTKNRIVWTRRRWCGKGSEEREKVRRWIRRDKCRYWSRPVLKHKFTHFASKPQTFRSRLLRVFLLACHCVCAADLFILFSICCQQTETMNEWNTMTFWRAKGVLAYSQFRRQLSIHYQTENRCVFVTLKWPFKSTRGVQLVVVCNPTSSWDIR